MRRLTALFSLVLLAIAPLATRADDASVAATRDKLWATLSSYSGMTFSKVDGHPNNFTASLASGLTHAQSMEVVAVVGTTGTITFYVYPHVRGGYINIVKAKQGSAMMKKLLKMNYTTFMSWGADDDSDVFAAFNFTLESGYPEDSIVNVLDSVKNQDQFVAELIPLM